MGLFFFKNKTPEKEPKNFHEAVRLFQASPKTHKNDMEYQFRIGRQVFEFGCELIDQEKLEMEDSYSWIYCGLSTVNMLREGVGCAPDAEESCRLLRRLVKIGGKHAQQKDKMSMDAYLMLVLCWEALGDYMLYGIGDKKNFGFARSLYDMALANTELFKEGEKMKKNLTEKREEAISGMVNFSDDSQEKDIANTRFWNTGKK